MIRSIIQTKKTGIIDLGFIERYGGVVIPITDYTIDQQGNKKQITFPVSCDIEGRACYEKGQYYELAPNDKYKSVAYWEVDNSATRQTSRHGGKYWQYSQRVRFVCWVHLANIGIESPCDFITNIQFSLIEELENKIDIVPSTPIRNVKMKYAGQPPKSTDIFRKYDYSKNAVLMMYPFDFFAIDVDVTWNVNKECLIGKNEYSKIECINSDDAAFTEGFTFGYES